MEYIPTTKLEAVNALLEVVNEDPISSIDVTITQADIAVNVLERVSKEVQTSGLNCNYEQNYTLPLNTDYQIEVPPNALSVICYDYDVVLRGGKLYDRTNHTYTFTKSIKVDIIFYLPFEDLPEHVRNYIVALARHRYQVVMQTDGSLDKMLQDELRSAIALFRSKEIKEQSLNFVDVCTTHPSYRRG